MSCELRLEVPQHSIFSFILLYLVSDHEEKPCFVLTCSSFVLSSFANAKVEKSDENLWAIIGLINDERTNRL